MAPTGSSTRMRSKKSTERTTRTPATAPIRIALEGDTLAQPAVIPTRPANAPFKLIPTSGFLNLIQEVAMANTAPVAAARLMVTKIMAMEVSAVVVEPGLNPNHPSHRINTPRAANGMLWPRIGRIAPFFPYFPSLGPNTMAPASAAHPPTECTTVEPAKSINPRASSHPPPLNSPPQAQEPNMG